MASEYRVPSYFCWGSGHDEKNEKTLDISSRLYLVKLFSMASHFTCTIYVCIKCADNDTNSDLVSIIDVRDEPAIQTGPTITILTLYSWETIQPLTRYE